MSQGLCLFDAQNRLEVVNRRFHEIFGLPRDLIEPGMTYQRRLDFSVAGAQPSGLNAPAQLLAEQAEFMRRRDRHRTITS